MRAGPSGMSRESFTIATVTETSASARLLRWPGEAWAHFMAMNAHAWAYQLRPIWLVRMDAGSPSGEKNCAPPPCGGDEAGSQGLCELPCGKGLLVARARNLPLDGVGGAAPAPYTRGWPRRGRRSLNHHRASSRALINDETDRHHADSRKESSHTSNSDRRRPPFGSLKKTDAFLAARQS